MCISSFNYIDFAKGVTLGKYAELVLVVLQRELRNARLVATYPEVAGVAIRWLA